nr:hypothetical protein 28 [bacterium]
MAIFEPVTLTYSGEDYTIPRDEILQVIAMIEDVVTLGELSGGGKVPMAKLAMAYGLALRHAGAKVSDEEVYSSLFAEGQHNATQAVTGLLAMMIPPERLRDPQPKEDGDAEKK